MHDQQFPFFRFPQTPHLAWLGEGAPRDDKVLSTQRVEDLLSGDVLVEEKLDGANLGISVNTSGELQVQNRGQYVESPYRGQFSRLNSWISEHKFSLLDHLQPEWIIFGEWCAARHSLHYKSLPDFFLLFDVYDRENQKFWNSFRRDSLASELALMTVPRLFYGKTGLSQLKELLVTTQSRYRDGVAEGIIIRKQSSEWCEARAKLVQASFIQTIDEHWSNRTLEWNNTKN